MKKVILGLILLILIAGTLIAPASADSWQNKRAPIVFGAFPSAYEQPVLNAMGTWNTAGSNFSFYYDSSRSRFEPRSIAFYMGNTINTSSAAASTNYISNGYIVDSVITFNSSCNWTTNGSRAPDVQTVALHELGHSAGVGHTSNSSDVMWSGALPVRRNLTTNDKNALKSLY
ncbi:matrixin family metalloprotease [Methanolapillus millepedarum]|uniref:Peptidase M10 metallopeptidase domain-containing protein n=1 Tax=Methanolapillus millepedarum TaxID=3028296 RepID=A0AA96V2U7_9EURY|nr:hypothetical protein MsAc7_04240 [Methanosarcinaceae archaeon Ac7]